VLEERTVKLEESFAPNATAVTSMKCDPLMVTIAPPPADTVNGETASTEATAAGTSFAAVNIVPAPLAVANIAPALGTRPDKLEVPAMMQSTVSAASAMWPMDKVRMAPVSARRAVFLF
jgi:hypothetical protein